MTQRNRLHPLAQVRGASWRLAAAVAAVPLLAALPARAQFPVQNGGHATDANNQVGSGGYNNAPQRGSSVNNNDIIYRNVTRGQGFQGGLQTTDPISFRGNLPGLTVDRFTANSNPAAVRGTPSANTLVPTVQPFFGETRFVTPPGFVSTLGNNGYVPAGTNQASTYNRNLLPNGTTAGSFQTGAGISTTTSADLNPVFGNGTYAPYGLDTIRVGPTDVNNQQTLLVVSPGFGIQQTPLDNATQNYFSSRTATRSGVGNDPFQRLTPDQLRGIQEELERVQTSNQPNRPNAAGQNANEPNGPNGPNGTSGQAAPALDQLGRPLPQPLETPANSAINAQALSSSLNAQPVTGQLQPGGGVARPQVAPGQQTPVYNQLTDRLNQLYPDRPQTVVDRGPNASTTAGGIGTSAGGVGTAAGGTGLPGGVGTAAPVAPGVGVPLGTPAAGAGAPRLPITGRNPGALGAPGSGRGTGLSGSTPAAGRGTIGAGGAPVTPGAPTAGSAADTSGGSAALARGTKTTPVRINTLTTGIKAKQFADLLKSAEELMKQGRYTSAIQQYTTAELIAPNNSLIRVGQAVAELGELSYRNAEQQLRQSFAGDPALLHAQFDLNAFLGEKRVGEITKDLKGLAAKETRAEMPAFLLAFVSYNTGHEADAMRYLDDAAKREGRADPVIQQMREHWYVPPAAGGPSTAPATPSTPAAPAAPARPRAPGAPGAGPVLNK